MHLLRKCPQCGIYTLKSHCLKCQMATVNPDPPRFSIIDKYGKYRRKMKKLKKKGNEGSSEKV